MSSTKQKLHLTGALAMLATLALGISCRGFFVNPTLSSITVGPSSASIPIGSTQQMTATGTFDDGSTQNITSKSGIVWQSSDQSAATVSSTGLVKGIATGSPTITAQFGTVSGQTTVNITLTNVTGIVVNPTTANIKSNGGTATFTALATVSGSSQQVDVSSQATWSITNPSNYTLTQGSTPETVTTTSTATPSEVDTLTATYTSGTTQFTATAKITVTQ